MTIGLVQIYSHTMGESLGQLAAPFHTLTKLHKTTGQRLQHLVNGITGHSHPGQLKIMLIVPGKGFIAHSRRSKSNNFQLLRRYP